MQRREPTQQRSRDRVDEIVEAAAELLDAGGIEALTTRSLAEHSGIPIPTIYRYFAGCDAIILAFLDREFEDLDTEVTRAVLKLERVSLRGLLRTSALAHMRYHSDHPVAAEVWFGGAQSAAVHEYVRQYDARMAAWMMCNAKAAGFYEADAPDWVLAVMVRMFDRLYEFIFLEQPEAAEREAIVMTFIETMIGMIERFATPRGIEGLDLDEFMAALQAART